jgi:hypothetical protein
VAIDYERMQANRRAQKSNLTRALNCTDLARKKSAVIKTCTDTVQQWQECGGWPDDWSRWQRALDAVRASVLLEELERIK